MYISSVKPGVMFNEWNTHLISMVSFLAVAPDGMNEFGDI